MLLESNYDGLVAGQDAYNARQESRLLVEDNMTKKSKVHEIISISQDPAKHISSVKVNNPYSTTNPLQCKFQCQCAACVPQVMAETAEPIANQFVSAFMPPPPPRLDTYDVISFCGAEDPDTIIYNMMVRWFTKASAVQRHFVGEDQLCPEPKPQEYDFVEWCRQVNEWWYEHFEHRQKKPVAQSTRRPW